MSIAHYFTFIRIFIGPIFFLLYIFYQEFGLTSAALPYALICILSISELSDAVDGYLARRYNQVTDLGKILDPMADSISRISVFLTFTQPPVNLPIPIIFIFIYRDSVISTLRTICALKGIALAARMSGKIKAVVQAIVAFLILGLMIAHSTYNLPAQSLQTWSAWLASFAAIYTIFSGIDYIYANKEFIARLLTLPSQKPPIS